MGFKFRDPNENTYTLLIILGIFAMIFLAVFGYCYWKNERRKDREHADSVGKKIRQNRDLAK